ncbi:MauE/DoxX family redox-associated membrane protein [Rothia sp. ARF10]|nr:MauE/DoxX family redox-associated membrane protein [Rothia sp. ARF10]
MQHPAWVLAPLALVAVLGFSASSKLGRGETLRTIVRNLELPDWVLPRALARAVPGIELVLAVLLLAPSEPLFTAAAVATLGLMLVYWALIARGLTLTPRPQCGCFGQVGDQSISGRTLTRNTLLVGAAAATVALAVSGRTVWSLWDGADRGDHLWLALAAGACLLTGLVVARRQSHVQASHVPAPSASTVEQWRRPRPDTPVDHGRNGVDDDAVLDYERVPIPTLVLHDPASGPATLAELASERAQLLVFVNCYCVSTQVVASNIGTWRARLPAIDVRVVFSVPYDASRLVEPVEAPLLDHAALAWFGLGLVQSPAAVLCGADGLLAAGPVNGQDAVLRLLDDIETELAEASAPTEV